jgi:putative effector of murein hydrolase
MLNVALLLSLTLVVLTVVLAITGDASVAGTSAIAFLLGGSVLAIAVQIYDDEL